MYVQREKEKGRKIEEWTILVNPTNQNILSFQPTLSQLQLKIVYKHNIAFVTTTSKKIKDLINTKQNNSKDGEIQSMTSNNCHEKYIGEKSRKLNKWRKKGVF